MAAEKTFVMLKPDCIYRGLVGEAIARIEKKGYCIVDIKMKTLEPKFLYEFYAHIVDKPFFLNIVDYMLSGSVIGIIVEGEGSVAGMRRVIGATRIEDARPGTIRGDFAESSVKNIIHASDSVEGAEKECATFFKKEF